MKRYFLRSAALALVFLGAAQAHAASADGKIDWSAKVVGRYSLDDSTRKSGNDFMDQKARLGMKYTQGRITAAMEVDFDGNRLGSAPTGSQDDTEDSGSNSVGVRKAYLDLRFVDNSNHMLSFTFGRFRPNGAMSWGNDAVSDYYGISGFNSEDGLALNYGGMFGWGTLNIQGAVTSAMPIDLYMATDATALAAVDFSTGGSDTFFAGSSGFGHGSATDAGDKAMLINAQADINAGPGVLGLAFAYGTQSNAIYTADYNATTAEVRDETYMELSVGYDYKGMISGGVWYTKADLGETYSSTSLVGGAWDTTGLAGNDVEDTYTVTGFGFQGTSKLFGKSGMLGSDDVFTFGAGWQRFAHSQSGPDASVIADLDKYDVKMLSAGVGYAYSKNFGFELNWAKFNSDNDAFADSDGVASEKDNAQVMYVKGEFSI